MTWAPGLHPWITTQWWKQCYVKLPRTIRSHWDRTLFDRASVGVIQIMSGENVRCGAALRVLQASVRAFTVALRVIDMRVTDVHSCRTGVCHILTGVCCCFTGGIYVVIRMNTPDLRI